MFRYLWVGVLAQKGQGVALPPVALASGWACRFADTTGRQGQALAMAAPPAHDPRRAPHTPGKWLRRSGEAWGKQPDKGERKTGRVEGEARINYQQKKPRRKWLRQVATHDKRRDQQQQEEVDDRVD